MASGQFTLEGASEVADLLTALPDRIADNVMRGALRAGAVVFQNRARQLAPIGSPPLPEGEKPGTLRKAISVTSRRLGEEIIAGVRISKKAFYWRFVEFGTSAKAGPGGGKGHKGHFATRAFPFMRPAFDGGMEAAGSAVVEYARARVEAEATNRGIFLQGFED